MTVRPRSRSPLATPGCARWASPSAGGCHPGVGVARAEHVLLVWAASIGGRRSQCCQVALCTSTVSGSQQVQIPENYTLVLEDYRLPLPPRSGTTKPPRRPPHPGRPRSRLLMPPSWATWETDQRLATGSRPEPPQVAASAVWQATVVAPAEWLARADRHVDSGRRAAWWRPAASSSSAGGRRRLTRGAVRQAGRGDRRRRHRRPARRAALLAQRQGRIAPRAPGRIRRTHVNAETDPDAAHRAGPREAVVSHVD